VKTKHLSFVHSRTLRLAGLLLIVAGFLALVLTGCGPSSDKTGKQAATNAAAPRVLAKTQAAPVRPVVRPTPTPPARNCCWASPTSAVATTGSKTTPAAVGRTFHYKHPPAATESRNCQTYAICKMRVLPQRVSSSLSVLAVVRRRLLKAKLRG
jgi:hypothetical protein